MFKAITVICRLLFKFNSINFYQFIIHQIHCNFSSSSKSWFLSIKASLNGSKPIRSFTWIPKKDFANEVPITTKNSLIFLIKSTTLVSIRMALATIYESLKRLAFRRSLETWKSSYFLPVKIKQKNTERIMFTARYSTNILGGKKGWKRALISIISPEE